MKTNKQLCAYNNFIIDYAKTLDLPEPNDETRKVWNKYIAPVNKLPRFFEYAKSKEVENLAETNGSVVNRLFDVVKDTRIYFKQVAGKFDYKMLMSKHVDDNNLIVSKQIDKDIIAAYVNANKYKRKYSRQYADLVSRNGKRKTPPVALKIRDEILDVHNNADDVANVLVNYLYAVKNGKNKRTLWESFGNEVLSNLRANVGVECQECDEVIIKPRQRQVLCDGCLADKKRERDRISARKRRQLKMSS